MAPHLAASWGDKEEEAATIEELGGFLLWLGIANADVRKGHGGIASALWGYSSRWGVSNLPFGVCAPPVGVSVRSAEGWKTVTVGKQAASNALRSGGIEMASNHLFRLRTPRTTPNAGVCQKT